MDLRYSKAPVSSWCWSTLSGRAGRSLDRPGRSLDEPGRSLDRPGRSLDRPGRSVVAGAAHRLALVNKKLLFLVRFWLNRLKAA